MISFNFIGKRFGCSTVMDYEEIEEIEGDMDISIQEQPLLFEPQRPIDYTPLYETDLERENRLNALFEEDRKQFENAYMAGFYTTIR